MKDTGGGESDVGGASGVGSAAPPRRGLVRLSATVHVERESQKGIVIGKGGQRIKAIGTAARAGLERLLGCRVFLELFVRVQRNWTRDPRSLRDFGYE